MHDGFSVITKSAVAAGRAPIDCESLSPPYTPNMELGILVCGEPAPRAIADHVTRLIAHGVLEHVRQGGGAT